MITLHIPRGSTTIDYYSVLIGIYSWIETDYIENSIMHKFILLIQQTLLLSALFSLLLYVYTFPLGVVGEVMCRSFCWFNASNVE